MKYIYSLILVALSLFVTSCSKSEQASNLSHEVEATFHINLQDGATARSIGDGTTAKALLYEIRQAGKVVSKRTIADAFAIDMTYSLTLKVIEGADYEYIFWAQKPDAPYGTENLSAIEMNYEDTPANDEGRDAFFAAGTFIGGEAVGEVVLKRPFAQFNVGAEHGVYENVEIAGMYMDYSTVELKKVPTVFHPLTGEASAPKDIRFVVTETPANQTGDSLVVTIDEVNYTYRYLSMNYLLAHTEKTLFDAWTGMYGTPNVLVMGNQVLNVPLQRNYRTNLLYFYKGGGGDPDDPDPDDPDDPNDPVDPDVPVNPDKPDDPDEPGKPDRPSGGGTIVDMVDGTFIIVVDPNFTSDHNKKK